MLPQATRIPSSTLNLCIISKSTVDMSVLLPLGHAPLYLTLLSSQSLENSDCSVDACPPGALVPHVRMRSFLRCSRLHSLSVWPCPAPCSTSPGSTETLGRGGTEDATLVARKKGHQLSPSFLSASYSFWLGTLDPLSHQMGSDQRHLGITCPGCWTPSAESSASSNTQELHRTEAAVPKEVRSHCVGVVSGGQWLRTRGIELGVRGL